MVFPFWDKPSETDVEAMRAAKAEQLAEHEAAVRRLAEAQDHPDGVTPPTNLPDWDGPNAGPGPHGAGR
jgi:hypothetical protein